MKRLFVIIACLVTLAACSRAELLNSLITREGYTVTYDIAYGSDPRQTFDLYRPANVKNPPLIVFIYGGGWKMGDKNDYRFLGQALTSKGFAVAVAGYRLYPQVRYPLFVEDTAAAITYIYNHATEYGADPERFFIAGHSAGAYNAMMVAADPSFMKQFGGNRDVIKGVIGLSGPYDFLPFEDDISPIFKGTADPDTQPINHITGRMPPVFLAHGDSDDVVYPRNSYHVKAKLEKLGSPVEMKLYSDTDHIDIILSLAEGFRGKTPLLEDITDFVNRRSQ